ncbi:MULTISPECIES: hypothetical protein [Ehrlichia]|uniref:Uncharacterized protein n=1 Tax=Ehrlichia cf. muris str. EmCRT TaxID=1359167 RepID=A0A0F3NC90_9RICK|nr:MULTISPECIES: hypothetical protein [Ehrlichia]KJV65361.1 hypothetical protein EMUCRT_0301 [Ehrlichia cf. muris str. EmCRT]OUC04688.1 hypothetical protein DB91_00555 [Ehrlichia sp. Wisconsin_h]
MIHNNNKFRIGNGALNVAAALSTVVALSTTILTVLSGMNLALDIKIPGIPEASTSVFLASFLAFATSIVLLLGASALSKHFALQEKNIDNHNDSSQEIQSSEENDDRPAPRIAADDVAPGGTPGGNLNAASRS